MTLAVVTTHYRLPESRLREWAEWNGRAFALLGVRAFVVSDVQRDVPGLTVLPYPEPLAEFSICRTSNFGIRQALDSGAQVVVKTDIDCVLPQEFLASAAMLQEGRGLCPRYWMASEASPAGLEAAKRSPHLIGTLALTAADWHKISGYRETMTGYGFDDADARQRARQAGVRVPLGSLPRVYHVAHVPGASPRKDAKWNRAEGFNPFRRENNREARHGVWSNPGWGSVTSVRV